VSEVALSIEGVSKRFTRHQRRSTVKEALHHPLERLRRDRFWALEDVNLRVDVGETIGLIGANGSGKSTLLRLIGGVGRPTRGRIVRHRHVEAMLSLGESLSPMLTGRENAITAGILAGFRRREIMARLDEIAAFAELEEFLDRPLRVYSDGMRVRLAFSVAISTRPDVFLIDEVLAVGDVRFQERCFARLAELQEAGTTIVLASHDESQVKRLCGRVVWLAGGRVQAAGSPDEVYEQYNAAMRVETERRAAAIGARPRAAAGVEGGARFGTYEVEIAAVRLLPGELPRVSSGSGPRLRIEIDLVPHDPVDGPIVGVSLHRVADYSKVLDVTTDADGARLGRLSAPRTVTLELDRLDVPGGSYRVDVGVYERNWAYVYDYHWHAYPLEVQTGGEGFGPSRRWST
jgi:lipopolysaccharide transport system ATP-binding protein